MFDLATGELPQATMVLPQRAAMHHPAPVAAPQRARHNCNPSLPSVGFFSNHIPLINLFLTRRDDFGFVQPQ
ncbi:hypothetical protein [Erythrobacter sp.]|uniref:hypothetical protein n=1 Tax=Erythrobacter sp. TaxID=1042 RepID=UPI0025E7E639|nr:hypothetical protein [Erythrobacter sp.]